MNRGGHLLKSYQVNTATSSVQASAYTPFGSTGDLGTPGGSVTVYNGGSQILGFYVGSSGQGGQIATVYPSIAINVPCLVPERTVYSLRSLTGTAQTTGIVSIDIYG